MPSQTSWAACLSGLQISSKWPSILTMIAVKDWSLWRRGESLEWLLGQPCILPHLQLWCSVSSLKQQWQWLYQESSMILKKGITWFKRTGRKYSSLAPSWCCCHTRIKRDKQWRAMESWLLNTGTTANSLVRECCPGPARSHSCLVTSLLRDKRSSIPSESMKKPRLSIQGRQKAGILLTPISYTSATALISSSSKLFAKQSNSF